MGMMMAVSFERYGRLYYLDPGPLTPRVGDKVLVPTDAGPEVADVIWAPQWVEDDVEGLPLCAGLATDEHLSRDEANRGRRAEARVAARRLAREHGLPMKIIGVDYVDDPNVYTIYFSAPGRVDFRALVRDLAARLRGRVELRQIGPRDEARLQGGIGPCGRDLCCSTFLKDFEPVSVRMAKDQELPVNPLRIAGACGRLMCCLKYEHPLYQDFRKDAPSIGSSVETPEGPGVVTGHSVPGDKIVVKLARDGSKCACPKASVCGSRQAYEAKYGEQPAGTPRSSPAPWPSRPAPPAVGAGAGRRHVRRRTRGLQHRLRRPARRQRTRLHCRGHPAGQHPDRRAGRAAADHPGRVLRPDTTVAGLRQGLPVRAAARPVRLPPARLAAVLAAGDPAARHRPGAADRLARRQPRRPRRLRDQLRAAGPHRDRRPGPRPFRCGRLRPPRGGRERTRRALPVRPAAGHLSLH